MFLVRRIDREQVVHQDVAIQLEARGLTTQLLAWLTQQSRAWATRSVLEARFAGIRRDEGNRGGSRGVS
jgi:pyridoxine/pyridoxamine 5'-phosphate oxidase